MRIEPFVSDLFFQLDLRLNSEKGGDTSTYVTNGEWHLIGESLSPSSRHCTVGQFRGQAVLLLREDSINFECKLIDLFVKIWVFFGTRKTPLMDQFINLYLKIN